MKKYTYINLDTLFSSTKVHKNIILRKAFDNTGNIMLEIKDESLPGPYKYAGVGRKNGFRMPCSLAGYYQNTKKNKFQKTVFQAKFQLFFACSEKEENVKMKK